MNFADTFQTKRIIGIIESLGGYKGIDFEV